MAGSKRRFVFATDRLSSAVFASASTIEGYVFDPGNLDRHFSVELWLDGWAYRLTRADLFDCRAPVAAASPQHGFCFSLPYPCLAREAEVRLANTPVVIGKPVDLTARPSPAQPQAAPGSAQWQGGLTIEGHLSDGSRRDLRIRGVVAGTIVFDVAPQGWTHVVTGDTSKAVPRFAAILPPAFADGRVHRVEVVTDDGRQLAGSPLDIVAFVDGLERVVSAKVGRFDEVLRARLFDKLAPRSIPFAWMADWLDRFPLQAPTSHTDEAVAVVLVGEGEIEPTVASLDASETPWVLGVLPCDEETLTFVTEDLKAFLETEASVCRTVVLASAGTRFDKKMAAWFAQSLRHERAIAFADVILDRHRTGQLPVTYNGFDRERLFEQGAGALLFAMTRDGVLTAALPENASLYDLLFSAIEHAGDTDPIHVPGFLATCRSPELAPHSGALARAVSAYFEGHGASVKSEVGRGSALPAVRVTRATAAERVSVFVPARDRVDDLRTTVDAIRSLRSRHGIDLHVVDMASADDATIKLMMGLTGHHQHVFRSGESHNIARALNRAIAHTRSRYLLFLESGCQFDAPDWIDELVGRCAEPDVAAAGPLLVTPDRIVEAAGVVCGARFGLAGAFAGASEDDPCIADILRIARSCSALPFSGLLTKRRDFLLAGGFDVDRFGRHLLSVDYGMRLGRLGRRLVISPHAKLVLPRWSTTCFDIDDLFRHRPGLVAEVDALHAAWGDDLYIDPRHSASLALSPRPFAALAWPPRRGSLHAPLAGALFPSEEVALEKTS